jgi:hypothetical protein
VAEQKVGIDQAAAQVLAQPCPCWGGRMFVIETFEAGCQPRHRSTAMRIDTSRANPQRSAPQPPRAFLAGQ